MIRAICVFVFVALQAISFGSSVESPVKATGTDASHDRREVILTNVAEFVPRRLGEKGLRMLLTALDDNHIEYHTTDYASTTLAMMPEQADAARKVLKVLVETEKLPIKILK